MVIRTSHDILAIDLLCPPANRRQTVLHRPCRQPLALPVFDQRLDVLGFERLGAHMSITQVVKLIGDLRQQTLPVPLGRKTAVPVAAANLFELVVQISQSVLAFSVSVSDLTGGRGHPVPLTRYGHGTPLPCDLKLPGLGNAGCPRWGLVRHGPTCPGRALFECGYTSPPFSYAEYFRG